MPYDAVIRKHTYLLILKLILRNSEDKNSYRTPLKNFLDLLERQEKQQEFSEV